MPEIKRISLKPEWSDTYDGFMYAHQGEVVAMISAELAADPEALAAVLDDIPYLEPPSAQEIEALNREVSHEH